MLVNGAADVSGANDEFCTVRIQVSFQMSFLNEAVTI